MVTGLLWKNSARVGDDLGGGDGILWVCRVGEFFDDAEEFFAVVGAGFEAGGEGVLLGIFQLFVVIAES